ncbi:MAG: hypothetical protein ACK5NF_02910 [Bacilli bacterium]
MEKEVKKKKPATRKPSTAKKKPSTKKTTTRKPSTTKKRPSTKKVAKKKIPSGLLESGETGSINLENSVINNKGKKRKKKKSSEKIFWIIILIIFAVSFAAVGIFIFKDYSKDPSTPAQISTEKISKENIELIESIGADNEYIESIEAIDQGPIIYVMYNVKEGTVRDDITKVIGENYQAMISTNPDLFKTYSFQITVDTANEAEGVNDYPTMGSLNKGKTGVKWMTRTGSFQEPVKE